MITEQRFSDSANKIGCEIAAIKAVADVESGGDGFMPTGEPRILFEPHIFWKQLRIKGIDPNKVLKDNPSYSDILYPVWGSKPYGKFSQQHIKLNRAAKINKDAALESASWGKFQILGMNWKACGVANLAGFISAIHISEDEHLNMFDDYIINSHLDDELINLDWKGFARGYNGPAYTKTKYDTKLATAYNKFK